MSILIDIKTGDPEDAGARYQLAGYAEAVNRSTDAVDFEPAAHVYRLKAGGAIVPSVTQILRDTGISLDFEEVGSFGAKVRQAIDVKREVGRALHADAHSFDDNDLDWSTVHPEVAPYLLAWAAFRENYPTLTPATRERIVYHPSLRYAGTLDGIFTTGAADVATVITGRWSVRLTPGKKVPYRVTPYADHYDDAQIWRSIVTTYWAQHARRRAA